MSELTANGVSLCYRFIATHFEGPLLVFLHEGLGSIAQWKDYPEKLCAEVQCPGLVYERQGYGNSDPLQEKRDNTYLHRYALEELPAVLETLGVVQDIILVGHSDGGSIALIYAAHHPQQVKGIVTEAAHVFVEDVTLAGITPVVKQYQQGGLKKALEKYHGTNTAAIFYGWADTWHLPSFRGWNIEALLPRITVPVLAIQGIDDEYGTPEQVAAIVAQTAGPATPLLVERCGHNPHQQATAPVLAATANFIQQLNT